jgi:hypothetical protein
MTFEHRGHLQPFTAGGAHLPAALRRGVVDGDSVGGLCAAALLRAVAPNFGAVREICHRLSAPGRDARSAVSILEWPYQEGLRLDEAMHPLAIMATGMYGRPLTNQQGAPIRLVVPWKYGFKSIKSVVTIELTDTIPGATWNTAAPNEYGFYANVNPQVDHPRWSQASERRIGEFGRRDTLMFNGYEEEVAYSVRRDGFEPQFLTCVICVNLWRVFEAVQELLVSKAYHFRSIMQVTEIEP